VIKQVLSNYSQAQEAFLLKGQIRQASMAKALKLSFISILINFFLLSQLFNKFFWVLIGISELMRRWSKEKQR